jgi:predicted regulator of Ras-like GTPase activity (Roadblock/LC7/MglB family)/FtsZ-binding cell division protein ZapB
VEKELVKVEGEVAAARASRPAKGEDTRPPTTAPAPAGEPEPTGDDTSSLATMAEALDEARIARDLALERLARAEAEAGELRAQAAMAAAHARRVGELDEESRRLRAAGRDSAGVVEQLAAARTELAALGRELTEVRARAEQARLLAQRLEASEAEGRELRATRAELSAQRAKAQRATARSRELERLREENRQLRAERTDLDRLRQALAPDEDASPETAEEQQMQQRVRALERAVAERAALRDRVEQLSKRVAEAAMPGEGEPAADTSQLLGGLASVADLRAAVVADDMGLLIAGVGQIAHQEDVAALSGLAGHLAARAQDLLSLGRVEQVQLTDVNDMVLLCRLFESGEEQFALATLTDRMPPDPEVVDRQLKELRAALG